jgi:hypothetical protein
MSIVIDNGSKESRESIALNIAAQSKTRLGRNANEILGWLIGESCTINKSEVPDFILRSSTGVIGIEHFEIAAGSIKQNGKWCSPLAGASMALHRYDQSIGAANKLEKEFEKFIQAAETSTYYSSIRAFRDIFNKHLKNVGRYRQQIIANGGNRLVFLIEMLSWNFVGLTAVGKKTFNCNEKKIPLCRDIVDIIATANEIDAVVLLFNLHPFQDSTVFAFTPQQARDENIGVEIYEYAGNDEFVESSFGRLKDSGVSMAQFYMAGNFETEKKAIKEVCIKAFNLIRSGKACVVNTGFYDTLINNGVIPDERLY